MDTMTKIAANNLRLMIESGASGEQTGPTVLELVQRLGGSPDVFFQASADGKHQLAMVYLVSLILTQPE